MPQDDWSDYASPTGPDTRQADLVCREKVIEYIERCAEVFAQQPDFPEAAGIQRLLSGLVDGVRRL